jgi:hypothetical protein
MVKFGFFVIHLFLSAKTNRNLSNLTVRKDFIIKLKLCLKIKLLILLFKLSLENLLYISQSLS